MDEEPEHRTGTSMRHKVMFLTAVARTKRDEYRDITFDGKIGCWALIQMKRAQRSSRNRPRGT